MLSIAQKSVLMLKDGVAIHSFKTYKLEFGSGEMARIWKGGCIIRARFLNKIKKAFSEISSFA
jgi:6-phosphogluconate dehydrogenase